MREPILVIGGYQPASIEDDRALLTGLQVVLAMGQTGSQANLNTDLVKTCEVELPELPEQTAIAAVLSDMDAELAMVEQRLAKTRELKQGMMQELLTGRTRLC